MVLLNGVVEPSVAAVTERVKHLDGWRVLALAMVLCDHLGNNSRIAALYDHYGLRFIADYGEVGVLIFFFISGNVVSRSCLDEVERTANFSVSAFYVRRLFRIVPPLMLYLFFCLLLGGLGLIDFAPANLVSAALYLCNTSAPLTACNWYVGHTWSLAFEEQFYLIYPIAFSWFELRKRASTIGTALVLSIAALPLIFPIWWIGKTVFLSAYALFFAGYLAAKHEKSLTRVASKSGNVALCLFAIAVFLPRGAIASFGESESAKAALIDLYHVIYVLAIPCLMLLSGQPRAILFKTLTRSSVVRFGRATYSIYLWQQLLTGRPFSDLDIVSQLALIAGLPLVCMFFYVRCELRLIEYGRRIAARFQSPASARTVDPDLIGDDVAGEQSAAADAADGRACSNKNNVREAVFS